MNLLALQKLIQEWLGLEKIFLPEAHRLLFCQERETDKVDETTGHDQVRPRCTQFFRVFANKAGIKLSEHVLWRHFFSSELVISGKQLCGWPDDLPIQHFSEMDYHKRTMEDWQRLWAVCLQKTLEIVDVDTNRPLANALVVTRCGDIVLSKSQSTQSSSTTRKQGHNEVGSDPNVPIIQPAPTR